MKTKKKTMKLKKAKKIETSLVAVLEFVRLTAQHNPKATAETLNKMGVNSEAFAPCVSQLVKLAIKNAEEIGACVYDVLNVLRAEAKRLRKKNKDPNTYNEDLRKIYESSSDEEEDDAENNDDENDAAEEDE